MIASGGKATWLAIGAIFITSVIAGSIISKKTREESPFNDRGLLSRGTGMPAIWLYYNTGDVNARSWGDFGARSSRVLNVPYLNLAYEAIVRHNSDKYRVEVINGISGAAELLGWDAIPESMRTMERQMNVREMNWLRSAVLARFGGLWLEPSSLCVSGFGKLPAKEVMFFGTDLDEQVVGSGGSRVPGFRAVWSPYAGHPVFVAWAADEYERVCGRRAGHLDSSEKWGYLAHTEGRSDVVVNVAAECGRGANNRRIELDTLLETSEDGRLPFAVSSDAVYVPVPWRELCGRSSLAWFLKMSEEQIMESELVVKWLLMK
jgi:hypothetical protein